MNFPPRAGLRGAGGRGLQRREVEDRRDDVPHHRFAAHRRDHRRAQPGRSVSPDHGRLEYRNPTFLWDAYNVDRLYAAGMPIRWQGHSGDNHEKLVLLYGQPPVDLRLVELDLRFGQLAARAQLLHHQAAIFSGSRAIRSDVEQRRSSRAPETIPSRRCRPTRRSTSCRRRAAQSALTATLLGTGACGRTTTTSISAPHPRRRCSPRTSTSDRARTHRVVQSNSRRRSSSPGTRTTTGTSSRRRWPTWRRRHRCGISRPRPSAPTSLPSGWNETTSARLALALAPCYSDGTFNVSGAGADVWGSADAFHYATRR